MKTDPLLFFFYISTDTQVHTTVCVRVCVCICTMHACVCKWLDACYGHGMHVWVCIWTWGAYCVFMCACLVSGVYVHNMRVHVRDSDPLLVFWWDRWVTAAVAEEAEVNEGEKQGRTGCGREGGKGQLFRRRRMRRKEKGAKRKCGNKGTLMKKGRRRDWRVEGSCQTGRIRSFCVSCLQNESISTLGAWDSERTQTWLKKHSVN